MVSESFRRVSSADGCDITLHQATWCNGREAPDARCGTNEVVQLIVCCATFVLSVGLLFFNAELVILRGRAWARVRVWARGCGRVAARIGVTIFSRANREPGARILCWYGRASVRVCRRMGVLVSIFSLFTLVCLSLFQQHAAQYH